MKCIYCKNETRVANSRLQKRVNKVWRRRHCMHCNTVFTSIESPDYSYSVIVNKPQSKIEAFSRDKLLITVFDSLKHRKTAYSDAAALTDTIIAKVSDAISGPGVDLSDITRITEQTLRDFDHAAATHYQAYYTKNS